MSDVEDHYTVNGLSKAVAVDPSQADQYMEELVRSTIDKTKTEKERLQARAILAERTLNAFEALLSAIRSHPNLEVDPKLTQSFEIAAEQARTTLEQLERDIEAA